jgi:hypothetical protein
MVDDMCRREVRVDSKEVVVTLQAINAAPREFRRRAVLIIANYIYWRLRTGNRKTEAEDYLPRPLPEEPSST